MPPKPPPSTTTRGRWEFSLGLALAGTSSSSAPRAGRLAGCQAPGSMTDSHHPGGMKPRFWLIAVLFMVGSALFALGSICFLASC
jgi:hypothetical protein